MENTGSLRRLCQNFEIGNFSSQRNLALTDFYKRKKTKQQQQQQQQQQNSIQVLQLLKNKVISKRLAKRNARNSRPHKNPKNKRDSEVYMRLILA